MPYELITITGPTATGKTSLAARLALKIGGEIISADSRQVYRNMNIGTGKDYEDYIVDGIKIPYHMIDIVNAGHEYNVYQYQADFMPIYKDIRNRERVPILCGGSGMYIDSVLRGYKLLRVPVNAELRKDLEEKSDPELIHRLIHLKELHNVTDTLSRKRMIRAIEIETYYKDNVQVDDNMTKIDYIIFGIKFDRNTIRRKITERLKIRLEGGMIEEVKQLLDKGLTPGKLKYYGLEYKFVTQHILGELNYNDMYQKLNTAIHQFAKRQMTWFRKIEREGVKINWIDGHLPIEEKLKYILDRI